MYRPVYITIEQLIKMDSCKIQLDFFRELFGNRVEISPNVAEEYYNKKHKYVGSSCERLDVNFVALRLLKNNFLKQYIEIIKPYFKKYSEIEKTAREKYEKERYKNIPGKWTFNNWQFSSNEYSKKNDLALSEYHKIIAKTFVELYIKQETSSLLKNEEF